MLFKWTPSFVPNKITIFGCGGTGSRLVPLVAQFMKSCRWVVDPEIILIDFDTVEEKNLTRQNFIPIDLGKNKALVLANRYSKAFNINITPIITKIKREGIISEAESTSYTQFSNILRNGGHGNNIFVLCVDSPEARKEIVSILINILGRSRNNLVIDSGNENDFGQVVISSILGMDKSDYIDSLKESTPISCSIPFIPMDPHYYGNMVAISTLNCAELDQTMAINTLMSATVFSIIQNIYYAKPLTFFRTNISLQHGVIPQHMDINYFKNISKEDYSSKETIAYAVRRTGFHQEFKIALDEQTKFLKSLEPVKEGIVEVKTVEVPKVKKAVKDHPVRNSTTINLGDITPSIPAGITVSTIGDLMNAIIGPP